MGLNTTMSVTEEGPSSGHHSPVFPRGQIRAGADRIVAQVGAWVLGELADRSGWTRGVAAALAPLKQRRRGHDRGPVLTPLAVAIADGATTLSEIAVLRHPPDLVGCVASAPTVWRTLTALTGETLTRIAAARAGRDAATGIPAGAGCGRRGWTRTSLSSTSTGRW